MKIVKAKDYRDMSRKAANIVSAQVLLYPKSVLGLATGETVIGMYKQLAEWNVKGDVDFCETVTFNLDEYIGLSTDNRQSYAWFMRDRFFSHINIKPCNTHIPNGLADDIEAECSQYDGQIRTSGGVDLQVLGLGHNGHIGFNEPNAAFTKNTHKVMLSTSTQNANARFFESREAVPQSAITMGMGTIMQAKRILLMCSGSDKAEILHACLYGDINPKYPGSILQLHSDLTVIADEAALANYPA